MQDHVEIDRVARSIVQAVQAWGDFAIAGRKAFGADHANRGKGFTGFSGPLERSMNPFFGEAVQGRFGVQDIGEVGDLVVVLDAHGVPVNLNGVATKWLRGRLCMGRLQRRVFERDVRGPRGA